MHAKPVILLADDKIIFLVSIGQHECPHTCSDTHHYIVLYDYFYHATSNE